MTLYAGYQCWHRRPRQRREWGCHHSGRKRGRNRRPPGLPSEPGGGLQPPRPAPPDGRRHRPRLRHRKLARGGDAAGHRHRCRIGRRNGRRPPGRRGRHRQWQERRHGQQGADRPGRPQHLAPRRRARRQPGPGGLGLRRHPDSRRVARGHLRRPHRNPVRHPQRHQQLHPHRNREARHALQRRPGRSPEAGLRRGRSGRRHRRFRRPLQVGLAGLVRLRRAAYPQLIAVEGIRRIVPVDFRYAHQLGRTIRLLGSARRKTTACLSGAPGPGAAQHRPGQRAGRLQRHLEPRRVRRRHVLLRSGRRLRPPAWPWSAT